MKTVDVRCTVEACEVNGVKQDVAKPAIIITPHWNLNTKLVNIDMPGSEEILTFYADDIRKAIENVLNS